MEDDTNLCNETMPLSIERNRRKKHEKMNPKQATDCRRGNHGTIRL